MNLAVGYFLPPELTTAFTAVATARFDLDRQIKM
jgi:hypothetical protein